MVAKPTRKPDRNPSQYTLPAWLIKRVRIEAATRGVRPCVVVEEILTDRFRKDRSTPLAAAS